MAMTLNDQMMSGERNVFVESFQKMHKCKNELFYESFLILLTREQFLKVIFYQN